MPSADLDAAVATAVEGAHDQQRPVVHRGQALHRARAVVRRVRARASSRAMAALRVGDPMDDDTELGPLATADQSSTIWTSRSTTSVARAARACSRGGDAARRPGLLLRADRARRHPAQTRRPTARSCSDPSRSLFRVADLDEAIALANDTPFGLGASVWTRDAGRARALRRRARGGHGVRQRDGGVRSARCRSAA